MIIIFVTTSVIPLRHFFHLTSSWNSCGHFQVLFFYHLPTSFSHLTPLSSLPNHGISIYTSHYFGLQIISVISRHRFISAVFTSNLFLIQPVLPLSVKYLLNTYLFLDSNCLTFYTKMPNVKISKRIFLKAIFALENTLQFDKLQSPSEF